MMAEADKGAAGEPDPLVGRTIGQYRVQVRLGAGAMGAVYQVRNQVIGRVAALKVLPAHLLRVPGYLERFRREARAASRLNHKNIVGIYHVGEEQGLHFIEMEYVDGESLQTVINREAPMSPERVVAIVMQVLDALALSFAEKIVHRDIKPENILITRDGEVKVADFGLAKSCDDEAVVTRPGCAVGTPLFMAPERFDGIANDLRSDLYSLGVAMYAMLTGQLPYAGRNVVEIVHNMKNTRPAPIESLNPAVSPALAAAVGKLMAHDAAQRYQAPEEVRADLAALHLGEAATTVRQHSVGAEPRWLLLRVCGEGRYERLELADDEFTIGRDEKNTLMLDDQGASRFHARLRPSEGGHALEDLDSRNGTRLNGETVHRAELSGGDLIGIGQTLLLYWPADDTQIAAPPPASGGKALRLVAVAGAGRGAEVVIGERPLIAGSGAVHLRLVDGEVAEFHAHFRRYRDYVFVHDLGSAGGTWCDDQRTRRKVLKVGDRVRIGGTTFAVCDEHGAPPGKVPTTVSAEAMDEEDGVPAGDTTAAGIALLEPQEQTVLRVRSEYYLHFTAGPRIGEALALASQPMVIGRGHGADFIVNDIKLSKRHARFTVVTGGVQVEDLQSTNGVYVNGQRIAKAVVFPGNAVHIGSSDMRIEEGGNPAQDAAGGGGMASAPRPAR